MWIPPFFLLGIMALHKVYVRGFAIRIAVILQKCLSSIKEIKMGILKWKMGKTLKKSGIRKVQLNLLFLN